MNANTFPNRLRSRPFSAENDKLLDVARRRDHAALLEHLWRQDRHLITNGASFHSDQLFENRVGMQALYSIFERHAAEWLEQGRNRVLEIGSGGGHLAYRLSWLGYRVSALDASAPRVLAHQTSHPDKRPGLPVRFLFGLSENMPFDDDTFDFVISQETLEHVLELGETLAESCRVAKRGALFFHQFPKGNFADGDNHLRHFEESDVRAIFNTPPMKLLQLVQIPYLVGEPPENWFVAGIHD